MASLATAPSPIAPTHGPILVGILVACILTGSISTQVFQYAIKFTADPTWIKCFVAAVFFLDLLSTIFGIWFIYDLLINNFANIAAFLHADWKLCSDPALVGVIGTICQLFYAWRIKILTGRIAPAALVAVFAVCSGLCGIGSGIAVGIIGDMTKLGSLKSIGVPWLVFSALTDVLITASITITLRGHRTGFHRTDHILNDITRLTIQNGMLTATMALVQLGTYVGQPESGIFIGISFILAKLYGISVINSLNARRSRLEAGPADTQNLTTNGGGRAFPTQQSALRFADPGTQVEPELVLLDVGKKGEMHQMLDMPSREPDADASSEWERQSSRGKAADVDMA